MKITCPHCEKALTVADEKAPPRPFHLSCPACQKRFEVTDSTAGQRVVSADIAGSADIAASADVLEHRRVSDPPPKLTPAEKALLASVAPNAYLVELTDSPATGIDSGLAHLGMQDVRRFDTLDEAVDSLRETEAGILLIRMGKASPPPCEPLQPLERLSYDVRRRTFVVLMADNVRSLDGQLAFYLQVNCLVASQDSARLAALVRRALLHHLRLYQHWTFSPGS